MEAAPVTPARLVAALLLPVAALPAQAGPAFGLCLDYGCKTVRQVGIDDQAWQRIRELFEPRPGSPAAERERVSRAIARLETLTGAIAGTSADRGGNVAGAGLPGQMDCIDESTNTSTYLRLLYDDGLLSWHRPAPRRKRARWIVDVHWTAVLEERGTGERYAIDSWFRDNGEPPVIQPLDDWLAKRRFE